MSKFYEGKRIVVTGGAGFLGQHLVRMLQEAGAIVFVPKRSDDPVLNSFDLRLGANVYPLVSEADLVFHLAARVSGIANTAATPADHIYDNAMMTLNVIDACARSKVKIIVAGSVCAYPKYTPMPMMEENLYNGYPEETNASYGAAKRMALDALKAYHQQHGLRCAYLLSANIYGPGDHFDLATSHVIPALIRKIDNAQKAGDAGISVWGSGNASRDFLYVEDAAKAYMLAGEKIDHPQPINIGSGQEVSIAGLVEMIKRAMCFQGDTVFDRSKPDGQPRRSLHIWKARDMLGWKPETRLDEGLRRTVEWYRGNHANIFADK